MNCSKLTLAAIFSLIILAGGLPTAAQTPSWSAATTAGAAAEQRGEYALAQAFYKQAIEIEQKTLGADNPAVAVSLNNLAVAYQDQAMYAQAEQSYRQALSILEKDPRQKALVALTLNNLAALYHDQRMDDKATPLYSRALVISGQLGNKGGANQAVAAAGLAEIFYSQNNDASAEPLYLTALAQW